MIDLDREEVLCLSDAARRLPAIRGRSLTPQTLRRWVRAGIRGVRLESIGLGGTRCTSIEAIQRFCEALDRRPSGVVIPSGRSPARRRKDRERAARELDRLGV